MGGYHSSHGPVPLVCAVLLTLGVAAAGAATNAFDFGPIVSRGPDLNGDARGRALGPFIEWRDAPDGRRLFACRPFYSAVADPARDRCEQNSLWPAYVRREVVGQSYWWLLYVVHMRDFDLHNPRSRYSFWILPVYFQGRDRNDVRYGALFPLGGTIREFLFQDEIRFYLFPLRLYTRVNDVESSTWLWPVVSRTTGHGHDKFRVFPFYGYAKRRDDYDKRFILWPFWTSVRYGFPQSAGEGYVLFPLYGHIKLKDQETWMVAPPFIRFSKGAKDDQVNCPWPFYRSSTGEVDKLYFWPIWGRRTIGRSEKQFALWPLGWSFRDDFITAQRHRVLALPFVYYEATRPGAPASAPAAQASSRYFNLWPLFAYARTQDVSRLSLLNLWPSIHPVEPVERNWAPLWTLYTRRTNGPRTEDELLWGLWRYRRSTAGMRDFTLFPVLDLGRDPEQDTSGWSLLKGFLAYERTGAVRRYRILYFFCF